MSDYRNPNDPLMRNSSYEPVGHYNASWGWIAGAVFLVIVFAIAFGVGHEPSRTASNEVAPPPAAHHMSPMAPPAGALTGALNPARPLAPGLAPTPAPAPTRP